MPDTNFQQRVEKITKRLMDEGFIIKAGWVGYRQLVMPPNCSDIQIRETQLAFYAGAQHLFGSIMSGLDTEKEPTEADMQRMSNIAKELEEFANKFRDVAMPPKGKS